MAESTMMAQTQRRTRIALFDNIKGLLIILVVAGHMMQPIHNDNPTLSTTFDIIYLFHMPLFVFMSGLLPRAPTVTARSTTTASFPLPCWASHTKRRCSP